MITFRFHLSETDYVTVLASDPKTAIKRFQGFWEDETDEDWMLNVPAFRLEQVV